MYANPYSSLEIFNALNQTSHDMGLLFIQLLAFMHWTGTCHWPVKRPMSISDPDQGWERRRNRPTLLRQRQILLHLLHTKSSNLFIVLQISLSVSLLDFTPLFINLARREQTNYYGDLIPGVTSKLSTFPNG
jgi:hypothetical protein